MIHYEQTGRTARVRIDRPERRGALDSDALDGLLSAQKQAAEAGVLALVLTGSDGNFCSGADLSRVEDSEFVASLTRVLEGFRDAPYPTIAAVDGYALGAGAQLAIACDLRISTANAVFGVPAAKIGLMVDWWTIERLVSLCGQGPARSLLLTTDRISGEQAFSWGLVQRIGDPDDAFEWARGIAALAPLSVRGMKLGLNLTDRAGGQPDLYRQAFEQAWASKDLQEGISAFRQRRAPEFRGD